MASRYFKRRWDEFRGDEHAHWGASTWLFEVAEDGYPVRQIEIYDDGPTLRYGSSHNEDEHGFLSYSKLVDTGDWTPWEIAQEEFDLTWTSTP